MNQVVAFDLDGTLVNSALHLLPAYHEGLARINHADLPDEILLQCIGGSQQDNHALVMPEASLETYREYEQIIAECAHKYAKERGQCYPHMQESLDALRAQGYLTVLCSNGTPEYALPLLAILGLSDHMDGIQKVITERNKTEVLAALIGDYDCSGHVVMVGDRHFDAEAARNNNVPFIGCRYGLFPNEIAESHADAVINSPSELLEAVNRLLK